MDGCDREHFGLGYCAGHYNRVRNHGDPQAPKPLRPRWGDGSGGYINAKGYRVLSGGQGLEHRAVMSQMLGRPLLRTAEIRERVHHKNGVRHDNRPENLELWVISQPAGQRVDDIVEHATAMLLQYAPERLNRDVSGLAS